MALAAALAAAAAGCGGDEAGSDLPASPEAAARAWVRAVDERDWDRVCELSTPVADDCPNSVARSFGDWKDPRLGNVITDGGSPRFEVTTADMRGETGPPEEEGWTAYAPIEILLERTDGGYLAHLEVAVIR